MESPTHAPDPFDAPLRAEPVSSGVRRVNNVPLLIVGVVLAVFVLIASMVAYDRADEVSEKAAESATVDEGLADQVLSASGGRTGGVVGVPDASASLSLPLAPVGEPDLPPLPPSPQPSPPPEQDSLEARLRSSRLVLLQNAIVAKSSAAARFAEAATGDRSDAAPAPQGARMPAAAGADAPLPPALPQADQSARNDADGPGEAGPRTPPTYGRFDRRGEGDRWQLDSRVEAPRTPFELRAGAVIPAILLSGINAELPGQIIAQVSQDVYDTPTGRHRLIPQGTRLIGTYDADVGYGQRRVLVAWQRLVFPDGKALDIGSMPGTDAGGYAGFKDKVDNHYLRVFGSALLMSGVIAGVSSSQSEPREDPFGTSTNTVLLQAVAQQLGRVAAEMIQRNLNIAPTLQIRPGFRFNVMAIKDLAFDKPYRPFDY